MKKLLLFLLIVNLSNLTKSQTTAIPDPAFEIALINLGYDNFPIDGVVPTANISNVPVLNVSGQLINNLTGIEAFTNLLELNCSGNNLTSLNVTQNTNLGVLNCGFNHLTSLNVTQNMYLYNLYCGGNQLSNLNVTQNNNLTMLQCPGNMLTNIDVSQNTLLTLLNLNNNLLTSLDVTHNTLLETLAFYNNQVTIIDVSQNTNLSHLECYDNQLTSLDVINNYVLATLNCNNNLISSLNLSQTWALTALNCSNNQLTCLNVSNGLNYGNNLYVEALNNPNLTCIQVDSVDWATTYWTNIDAQTSLSTSCPNYCAPVTFIPDVNFEQALINLGYDIGFPNGYVITSKIVNVTNLDVSSKNIGDLTGIEDFTALTFLNCNNNNLTNLDVTHNTLLTLLSCGFNPLTTLDVTQNTSLQFLDVISCQISYMDLSHCTDLIEVWCTNNQLNSLNLSNSPNLRYLDCSDNNLTNLNLSNNPALYSLWCHTNQLTCLNLRNGTNSTTLQNVQAYLNPSLSCIQVDSISYWYPGYFDAGVVFSQNCPNPCFVGIEEIKTSLIKVFPNPTTNVLTIANGKGIYLISDVFGRIVKEVNITTDNFQLNTNNFKSGIYFLISKEDNSSIKFIKQ